MLRRREGFVAHANRPAGGPPRHAHSDQLGSERLAAWANQTLVSEEVYAPFGEAYAGAGAGEQMLTGKGQRLAAGIHDFPFCHYSPAQGRWLSPDPSGLAAVNPANPQSWNAYAYVANQPLSATDPLGLNWNYRNNTACAPLPGTQVFQGVPYVCANGGSEGEVQTFTVSATPEAAPAPMWEMACGADCISGVLGDAVASLQAAVNSFVNEMSSHPDSPGASGGGGVGGGSVAGSVATSGPANRGVPLNPRAQAIFSLVGQETGSLTNWKFWAGWEGASLAAGAVPSLGPLYDAAGDSALSVEAAAPGTTASASDFLDSMMAGSPPSLSWGGAAALLVQWYMWLRCGKGGC